MLDCRYYGNCYFMECDVPDKCDRNGNCESYRRGHEIKTVCRFYSPMPDVNALLELADEMDSAGEDGLLVRDSGLVAWTRRIRKALGVEGL